MIADYAGVFLFDSSTGHMRRVSVSGASLFNPTDLTVDGDRVFIANYHGNNLLEGRLDEAAYTLAITGEIGTSETISPEGVAWDGKRLAAANYDASNVQVFSQDGGAWKLSCQLPVGLAHGVAFNGGYLYATSLADRTVVKINPDECRVERSSGSQGWGLGQFLWPTSVAAFGPRQIIVSDAHTGVITVLSAGKLKPLGSWGDNGPGITGHNMPYDATPAGNQLWVASTFDRRLLSYDKETGKLLQSWGFDRGWAEESPREALMTGQKYDSYIRKDAPFQFLGDCYYAGYARLHRCEDVTKTFELPAEIEGGGQLYFVQAARGRRGTFLTSPQNVYALYFPEGSNAWKKVLLERDNWVIDGQLVGRNGAVDLQVIEMTNFAMDAPSYVHSVDDIKAAARVLKSESSNGQRPASNP